MESGRQPITNRKIPLEERITGRPLPVNAVVLRDLKERIALTLNPDINDGMNGAITQSVHQGARSQLSAGNRAISSVGSEHLPYKQGVGGPNPSSPTRDT